MALIDAVKKAKRNGHLVVAEGDTSQWNSSWPLLQEVRSARTGLILQPDSMDGELILRTPTPKVRRGEMPVGRGYWVSAGLPSKSRSRSWSERSRRSTVTGTEPVL